MVRDYIVKAACLLTLVGFAAGVAGQIELITPGILFLDPSVWPLLLNVHIWATTISLITICLSTLPLVRHRILAGHFAIWMGPAVVPLLLGLVISLMLFNVQSSENYLADTTYLTASRHAYGTVGLMVSLGGLSAFYRMSHENFSLKFSFIFAPLIMISGTALASFQAVLGLSGFPRRYIDYPKEFAQLQFYSGISSLACLGLSIVFLIILWRYSKKHSKNVEGVF